MKRSDRAIEDILRHPVGGLARMFFEEKRPVPRGLLEGLEQDPRRAARELGRKLRKRERGNRSEGQRLHRLLRFEIELWRDGYELVGGVDEAGMAPLAGPVVAAAVILRKDYK